MKISRVWAEGDCAYKLLLLMHSNPVLFESDGLVPISEAVKRQLIELVRAKIDEEAMSEDWV